MTIDAVAFERSSSRIVVPNNRFLREGDVLEIDGGEIVYVENMTVGDYFTEATMCQYKPIIRERVKKIDKRPYYRKFEKRHPSR